jgi:hypothetical protein
MKKLICIVLLLLVVGCTANQRARQLGGTMSMDLPRNQKLVTVTWKEAELWYLVRPMRADEVAETYEFKESSSFGVWEGTVKIVERK